MTKMGSSSSTPKMKLIDLTLVVGSFLFINVFSLDKKMKFDYNEYILNE